MSSARTRATGFSEAELAAAAWRRQEIGDTAPPPDEDRKRVFRYKKKKSDGDKKRHSSRERHRRSVSSRGSNSSTPRRDGHRSRHTRRPKHARRSRSPGVTATSREDKQSRRWREPDDSSEDDCRRGYSRRHDSHRGSRRDPRGATGDGVGKESRRDHHSTEDKSHRSAKRDLEIEAGEVRSRGDSPNRATKEEHNKHDQAQRRPSSPHKGNDDTVLAKINERPPPINPLGLMYQATTVGAVALNTAQNKATETKHPRHDDHTSSTPPRASSSPSHKERSRRQAADRSPSFAHKDGTKHKDDDKPRTARRRSPSIERGGRSPADKSRRSSISRSPGPRHIPRDPVNPLDAAYDRRAYFENRHRKKKNPDRQREPQWQHDRFLTRSESPNRERTEGPMWDTRKEAWISRAGGQYIEARRRPRRDHSSDDDEGARAEPARYRYPDQFRRAGPDPTTRQRVASRSRSPMCSRRSPSYTLD
eukprot:Selendium_serpulae@DN4920_c0_g1_i2.p1